MHLNFYYIKLKKVDSHNICSSLMPMINYKNIVLYNYYYNSYLALNCNDTIVKYMIKNINHIDLDGVSGCAFDYNMRLD